MSKSTSQSASTWTEPPWSGWIETTGDALLILEAARRGLIPRVTRRLVDSERKMITSGSVFVFDEEESGIKRWTDGFVWSPSRILGNFLLYRETDKRGPNSRTAHAHHDEEGSSSLARPKGDPIAGGDRTRERALVGSLTNSYKFKPEGMMKKTFSLTIGGVSQHLISYYKIEDVEQGRLRAPSSLPELSSLDISPEYLDKTHFRAPPRVEVGEDGIPRYRGEGDDTESSSRVHSAMLSESVDSGAASTSSTTPTTSGRAGRRYGPYNSSGTKRSRKSKAAQQADAQAHPQHPPYPHDPNNPYPAYAGYSVPPYMVPAGYPYPPGYPPPPPQPGMEHQPGQPPYPYYPPPPPGAAPGQYPMVPYPYPYAPHPPALPPPQPAAEGGEKGEGEQQAEGSGSKSPGTADEEEGSP